MVLHDTTSIMVIFFVKTSLHFDLDWKMQANLIIYSKRNDLNFMQEQEVLLQWSQNVRKYI